jgi:hypothetical protein
MTDKTVPKEERKTDEIASCDPATGFAADSGGHVFGRRGYSFADVFVP